MPLQDRLDVPRGCRATTQSFGLGETSVEDATFRSRSTVSRSPRRRLPEGGAYLFVASFCFVKGTNLLIFRTEGCKARLRETTAMLATTTYEDLQLQQIHQQQLL